MLCTERRLACVSACAQDFEEALAHRPHNLELQIEALKVELEVKERHLLQKDETLNDMTKLGSKMRHDLEALKRSKGVWL